MKRIVIIAIALFAVVALALGHELLQQVNYANAHCDTENENFIEICPSIDTTANIIVDRSGSLDNFIRLLTQLKCGEDNIVSIIHLGDSHIQGSYFTKVMRQSFQRDFGNAGRGLITPTKLMGTNGARDYGISSPNNWRPIKCTVREDCDRLGASGLGIDCNDGDIEITIECDDRFSSVRVLHHENAPRLLEPEELETSFCCTTDDKDHTTRIVLNKDVDKLTLRGRTDNEYNKHIYYGFILENGNKGVLYNAMGANGAAFSHFDNERLINGISEIGADMIIISLGTNDSYGHNFNAESIRANLDSVVSKIRATNPNIAILLTTPMETRQSVRNKRGRRTITTNNNVKQVARTIVDYATENGLAYWDFYTVAGGAGANSAWSQRNLVRPDMVHLSIEGYELQGKLLYQALINHYNRRLK